MNSFLAYKGRVAALSSSRASIGAAGLQGGLGTVDSNGYATWDSYKSCHLCFPVSHLFVSGIPGPETGLLPP